MVLLCLADIHGEDEGLRRIIDASPEAEVIIVAGDITHLGGYEDAERVFAPILASDRRVYAVAGNMDGDEVRRFLEERGINIHGRGVGLGSFGIQGLGGSNHSPFHTPFEIRGDEARRLLSNGYADIAGRDFRILVSHAPPKNTRIDKSFTGMHVGSREVHDFLLAGNHDLCICGHIHEASGEDTLGRTVCVNVGPYKNGRYALVKIENGAVDISWRNK
jgi:hypothetical protein